MKERNRRLVLLGAAAVLAGQLTACAGDTAGSEKQEGTEKQETAKEPEISAEELYEAAVLDAMTVEEEEILPVISLAKGEEYAVYNETGDKILLLTWHHYPDSYPDGAEVKIQWGNVWTFSPAELEAWYEENQEGTKDWELRLEQLIGLEPGSENTHFTAMWVSPEEVIRPAYVTDITETEMAGEFQEEPEEAYKAWFDENIINSYFDGAAPWTRLGYTYDWCDNGTEYGLSEFLVKDGAEVQVEYTGTTEEFLNQLERRSAA